MRYLIGNWKSNKTFEETYRWFDQFAQVYAPVPDLTVVVSVPSPYIQEANKKISELKLKHVAVGAQDVSPYPFGAYTGAVSANMLKHHVGFCIVGHSERRNYFAESHLEVANKVSRLLEVSIKPVLCIDEPYAQKQFAAIDQSELVRTIVAYEPLEAIGTGNPAEPSHVANVVKNIKLLLDSDSVPIIYGGSTNAANTTDYLKIEGVSGLLPGGSSLNPNVFAEMVQMYMV